MKNKEGREISIWSDRGARGRDGGDEDGKLVVDEAKFEFVDL